MDKNDLVIQIEGSIGESSSFFGTDLSRAQNLIIDFEHATYINSVGVRAWLSWMQRVQKNVKVHLKNCSPLIVSQMNMVHGFVPENAIVESFFVPMICDDCGHESRYLMQLGNDFDKKEADAGASIHIPKIACEKCQSTMEADCNTKSYFQFLEKPTK